MKKRVSFFSAIVLTAMMVMLSACGGAQTQNAEPNSSAKNAGEVQSASNGNQSGVGTDKDNAKQLQIVTTIFPEYDWAKNILGKNPAGVELTMLLNNGVDLHSYQPTADDILKISTCDLFVYVGGESDTWVKDALKEATNKNMEVMNLLETLGESVKEEEVVEGMQEDPDEDAHDHEGDHADAKDNDGDHEDATDHNDKEQEDHDADAEACEVEYDEHVWLSLRNAETLVKALSDKIQKMDPSNAALYQENTDAYLAKLEGLDKEYTDTVKKAKFHTLLFGDRFPFRYLTEDYHLQYYAAFVGCSAETEASFATISFLAKKMDELKLPVVLTIEGKDHRIAETIVQNTKAKNAQILSMDSMQSTTAKDVEEGASYLKIMQENLKVLKKALL